VGKGGEDGESLIVDLQILSSVVAIVGLSSGFNTFPGDPLWRFTRGVLFQRAAQ